MLYTVDIYTSICHRHAPKLMQHIKYQQQRTNKYVIQHFSRLAYLRWTSVVRARALERRVTANIATQNALARLFLINILERDSNVRPLNMRNVCLAEEIPQIFYGFFFFFLLLCMMWWWMWAIPFLFRFRANHWTGKLVRFMKKLHGEIFLNILFSLSRNITNILASLFF